MMDYLLTLISIFPFFLLGVWKSGNSDNADDLFSKDYTTVLKGICSIIVVMVHIHSRYQNPLQDAIGSFGFICVTLFFMISSFGMQLSVERKSDYLRFFWRNRLLSLLVPCFVTNLIFYICKLVVVGKSSAIALVYINHYVVVLLEYCLWFYLVMLLKKKLNCNQAIWFDALLTVGVVFSSLFIYLSKASKGDSVSMGWCYERLGLVWGLWFYRFMPLVKRWLIDKRRVKFILFTSLALILGVIYLKYKEIFFYGEYMLKIALGLVIIIWLLLLTVKRKFGNKASLYIGKISYEIYLSHGMVMTIISVILPNISSGVFILFTYVATILFSIVAHSLGSLLITKFRAK